MDQHISSNCVPPPKTTSTKPYSCSFGKCKNRVAVKLICSGCNKSYCIKHRLGVDHLCEQVQRENKSSKLDIMTSVNALSNSFSNLTTSSSTSGTPATSTNSSASSKARNLNKKVKNSWVGKLFK